MKYKKIIEFLKITRYSTYDMSFSNSSRKATTTARATSAPVVIIPHFALRTVNSQQIDISVGIIKFKLSNYNDVHVKKTCRANYLISA